MMLSSVRDRLREMRAASIGQLCAELDADRESVEAAIAYWVHRGDAREIRTTAACGTCSGCEGGSEVPGRRSDQVYEWMEGIHESFI